MFSAVNYYTGQFFDCADIAAKCCEHEIIFGLDLAHAIGNVELKLHEWKVDFATWCSYKYLNSGPGGVSGVFVHDYHAKNYDLPRLAGWWGNEEKTRFEMHKHFRPQAGAAGWQISNAPVLSMAAHQASLEIFDRATIEALREKSLKLTGYLEFLLNDLAEELKFEIITPRDPARRGCQLSILAENGQELFRHLAANAVIADWRAPEVNSGKAGVIRVAPVPLYNSFEDVWQFVQILRSGPRL
jgi:kynureninase